MAFLAGRAASSSSGGSGLSWRGRSPRSRRSLRRFGVCPPRNACGAAASRRGRSPKSITWLASGTTWQCRRKTPPGQRSVPCSIGRCGGQGSGPRCRAKPSSINALVMAGTSAGLAVICESAAFLPVRPGTAVLSACSAAVPSAPASCPARIGPGSPAQVISSRTRPAHQPGVSGR